MMPADRERAGETGSILIEALVAVAIVAAMAGLWFNTLAQGAAAERATADRRTALLVARSQLATVGVYTAAAPGVTSGRDAGMAWRIDITPFPEAGQGMEQVVVSVGRPGAAALATLRTLRFGP